MYRWEVELSEAPIQTVSFTAPQSLNKDIEQVNCGRFGLGGLLANVVINEVLNGNQEQICICFNDRWQYLLCFNKSMF
jgi:hypothetical protein